MPQLVHIYVLWQLDTFGHRHPAIFGPILCRESRCFWWHISTPPKSGWWHKNNFYEVWGALLIATWQLDNLTRKLENFTGFQHLSDFQKKKLCLVSSPCWKVKMFVLLFHSPPWHVYWPIIELTYHLRRSGQFENGSKFYSKLAQYLSIGPFEWLWLVWPSVGAKAKIPIWPSFTSCSLLRQSSAFISDRKREW